MGRSCVLGFIVALSFFAPKAFAQVADCDRLAGSPRDRGLPTGIVGVETDKIDLSSAQKACSVALQAAPNEPRLQFEMGRVQARLGKIEQAANLITSAAKQGYARAEVSLGVALDNGGHGSISDNVAAVHFYQLAADQGDSDAEYNLAVDYETGGDDLPIDGSKAVHFYQLAAAQGDSLAENNLAVDYEKGANVAESDVEALRLFQLSAAQGCEPAKDNLQMLEAISHTASARSTK